jgi:hypothetical protein
MTAENILRVPIRLDGLYVDTTTLELGLPMTSHNFRTTFRMEPITKVRQTSRSLLSTKHLDALMELPVVCHSRKDCISIGRSPMRSQPVIIAAKERNSHPFQIAG